MMKKSEHLILFLLVGLALSACSGAPAATTPPTVTPLPPTETALPPTNTAIPPTETPLPTITPVPELEVDLNIKLPEGDPLLGEITALNYQCTGCHDNRSFPNENGPEFAAGDDLLPILERAELRLTDPAYQGSATTGQEYLVESILYPEAYILPGDWLETMPDTFHEELTAQDLADLIAWMETFSEMEPETAAEQPTSTPEPQGALIAGDPQRGQEIFETGGGVINTKCINCHTLDGSEADGNNAGPSMLGIATTAVERVPGLSAGEYLLQSILDPSAYVAEGYEDRMEKSYQWLLNEEDQAALVAFLLTLE